MITQFLRIFFVLVSSLGFIFFKLSYTWAIQAQPVPIPEDNSLFPQINISGVGIASGTFGRNSDQNKGQVGVDYSDSTLQIGAAQRLYNQSVGSMGVGILALGNDGKTYGTPLFLSQAFVDYQSENIEFLFGRTDNPTAHLVDFPTLRDDDLFTLNNPLNPFSTGSVAQEHRYSNVIEMTLNQGLQFFENFHVQQLINSAGVGNSSGMNSFGATFQYLATPGLEAFAFFPSLGIGVEHITGIGSGGLTQIYGGGVINLTESVTHRWDFRLQEIVSLGSDLYEFATIRDSFEANFHAVAAAIKYMHSPFGRPGYQVSLTTGFKNYFKVSHANSFGFALTGIKRLGEGFDLAIEYLGQWRDEALSRVQSNALAFEQTVHVGFIFNWDATFNQHISPRRSILNQQFQYIPN